MAQLGRYSYNPFDAGFSAWFLNGSYYIGTAIANYLLGHMQDASGWSGFLILLIGIVILFSIFATVYLFYGKLRLHKQRQCY